MKIIQFAAPLVIAGAAFCSSAKAADTPSFATASAAQGVCGADVVVWIDLDRGRYYKEGTADYAKSKNGVYACEHAAHAKYREGKSEPSAVATK